MRNFPILTILFLWAGVSSAQNLVWTDSTNNDPIQIVNTLVTTSHQNVIFSTVYSQDYGHTGGAYSILRLLDGNTYAVIDSMMIGAPWRDAVMVDLEQRNDTIYGLAYTSTEHSNANEVYLMRLAPDLSVYGIDTILYFSFNAPFKPGSIELLGNTAFISGVSQSLSSLGGHVIRYRLNGGIVIGEYYNDHSSNPLLSILNDGSFYTFGYSPINFVDNSYANSIQIDTRGLGVTEVVEPINDSVFLFAGGGGNGPVIGFGNNQGDTLPTKSRFFPSLIPSIIPKVRSCPSCIAIENPNNAFLAYTHGINGAYPPSNDISTLAIYRYDFKNDSLDWVKTVTTGNKDAIYGTHYSGKLLYFYGGSQDLSVFPGAVKTRPFIYAIDSTGSFLNLPDSEINQPKSCLSIYPTVVDQYLKITSCTALQQLTYRIISINGVQVDSGEFYPIDQVNDLFLGHLKPGVYVIQLINEKQVLSQRIIKK